VLTGTLVTFTQFTAYYLMGLFLPGDSPAVGIAVHANHIAAWSFVFFGLSIVMTGVVRAAGSVVMPLLILVFALWLVRFPFALWLMTKLHADAIWWSFPVASFLGLIITALYYKHGKWRQARMMQPAAASAETTAAATTSVAPLE
jgi:Na+-driven multidrug efflux pump